MPKTPGKMHMYDMVKIDAIVFEIVWGGGGLLKPPPPGSDSPDRIGLIILLHDFLFVNRLVKSHISINVLCLYICIHLYVDFGSWNAFPIISLLWEICDVLPVIPY